MPTLAELPHALLVGVAVALGLLFGSFLNVVIHRWPRGESVVHPGSRCPACGKPIRAWDNIPVLSWLMMMGKARCCGARVSPRYPLVEALGGLVGWAIVETRVAALPLEAPAWQVLAVFSAFFALALGLVAAAFIDLEHMLLPDEITIGGSVLGILGTFVRPDADLLSSLIGAVAGFLIIWLPFDLLYGLVRGRPGMGMGDAKLCMLAGAWFGWQGAVFALLAGAVQGTLVTLAVFVARGKIDEPEAVKREREEMRAAIEAAEGEEKEALLAELAKDPIADDPEEGLGKARLAFGPFLVLATLEYLLFGGAIVEGTVSWLAIM